MPTVLQLGPLLPLVEHELARLYTLHHLGQAADPKALLAAEGPAIEALVTSGRNGADAALLDALPNLRVIAHFGVGYDNVDVACARARGVPVSNTPGVLDDCVADLALGLLIDAARGISAGDRHVRAGRWRSGARPLATRVSGKRLGILGLGRIGMAIAKRAAGFDFEIRYHNRTPKAGVAWAREPSPEALARWCDFLVVATAGGEGTRGLVSAAVIAALGPEGCLVNVSRGSVVDEPALVEALASGRLGGAALDVFADEPRVPEALLALDNVVLTPHIASATRETREAMGRLVLANLESFFRDGRLLTPV